MTELNTLQTPALLADLPRLKANAAKMNARAEALGVRFRPHVKTCKSINVFRILSGGRPDCPIMVSTLKEAAYFLEYGVTDIMYGVGVSPDKLPAIAALAARGADIAVILDNLETARAVTAAGRELGHEFKVHVEIDADGHRSGVRADDPVLIDIGRVLHGEAGARLSGVVAHAGDSYDCPAPEAIAAHAELERAQTVAAALALRGAGLPCDAVSVGSTPTATFAESLEGVTELRAGVYSFQDLFQAGLGVCGVCDIALSVLATVIGRNEAKNRIITDAGWMAMSRDRGTAGQAVDQGYGLVCDLDGRPIGDLIVAGANQEHGLIEDREGRPLNFAAFPIGTKLRILPNHACATSAQYSQYTVTEGRRIVDRWSRIGGW